MNKHFSVSGQANTFYADLEDFFENGPIGLHLVAADGTILRANKAELDLLGYRREEYEGRHIAEFHADPETIKDILNRLGCGEKLDRYPASLKAKDGSIKYVQISSNGRFYGGEFVHSRCFTVDVTEAKRAEKRSQGNYRQLLEALPAAVYVTDAAGRVTYCNHTAAELAGRSPDIGKDEWCVTWKLYRADGTPLPHEQCPMAIALKEKRPIRGVEAILERPDGTRAPFLPFPTPIFDEETSELTGAVNMLVDISEHKQAARTHELLIKELHHRIKNTLANVQALAQHTLRRSASPAEFVANFSGRIQALARAHSLLTNESWQAIDLKALIEDQLQASAMPEEQLKIYGPDLKLEPEMALHVAMLLHELHGNALRHGAYAVGKGQVSISWTVKDWVLRLRWRERGGPALSLPGKRGFGTMLIEQSAKAHGGEAQLSCDAQGLTWDISLALPRVPRTNEVFMSTYLDRGRGHDERGERSDRMNALAGKRVLVVEDEPLIALEQAASLEDLGMEPVGPVGTVEEALRLIGSVPLDAALLDGNLAGHPVDEVAAALTRQGVPFVFVTGYGRASLPQAFQSAPMIAKPCTLDALLAMMGRLFTRDDGDAIPLRGRPSR